MLVLLKLEFTKSTFCPMYYASIHIFFNRHRFIFSGIKATLPTHYIVKVVLLLPIFTHPIASHWLRSFIKQQQNNRCFDFSKDFTGTFK